MKSKVSEETKKSKRNIMQEKWRGYKEKEYFQFLKSK